MIPYSQDYPLMAIDVGREARLRTRDYLKRIGPNQRGLLRGMIAECLSQASLSPMQAVPEQTQCLALVLAGLSLAELSESIDNEQVAELN